MVQLIFWIPPSKLTFPQKNSSYRPPMHILRPPLPVKFRDTPQGGETKPGSRTRKAFQALPRRPLTPWKPL